MKKTLIIAAIALIITAGITSFVSAQERDRANRPGLTTEMEAERDAHRAEMESQREEMQNIMENGTFEEWKTEVESRPKMTDYITSDNFSKFQEAHQLKQAGDHEAAQEIMDELGIKGKMGMRMRKGGHDKGMHKRINADCPLE
jgi:hypothetical protein